jgi:hypothetical protein
MLKKMLEGQIGEERGWMAKKRLLKLAKAYVKLRDMGLMDITTSMTTSMIRSISIIYETEYEKRTRGGES